MNKLFYFLAFLGSCLVTQAEQKSPSFYKNLTGKGEVFYTTVLAKIQSKELALNDTAYWLVDSSIVFFSSQKNQCALSHAYAIKGRLFYNETRSDSATKYFIEAAKKLNDDCSKTNKYYLYNSWALLSKSLKEYDNSDSLNALAYDAALEIEDKTYLLNVLINKSILYSEQGNYPKAIWLMKDVYRNAIAYNSPYQEIVCLQNLGAFYIDLEHYDSALFVYSQLDSLITEDTPPRVVMDLSNNRGLIYYNKGDLQKADEFYTKAIELARSYKQLKVLLIYLENYAELKYSQGQYKVASDYLTESISLKDSLFNAEKYIITKNLETQYQTAKQREKIFALEKKALEQDLAITRETKNRNTLFFVVGGLLLIIIASLSRLNYVRKSKRIVEREKKRSDDLLLNILPEEVADELKNTGKSEAKSFKNVTVLFTDFKDFTIASETFTASELVEELNFYFVNFDNVVSKYDVEKIKTIGDSYMAASGVPNSNLESAKTMVKVALEIMSLTIKHNNENEKKGKPRLDMRIGIHTGPVIAGIVGVKKFQYDIWGDTVNIASRMESACHINQINISESTYQILKDDPELSFTSRGKINVKGKGNLEMYFVSLKA